MSDFRLAYLFVRDNERGVVNHPSDPGGVTNDGISLRYLRQLGDLDFDMDGDGDIDADDVLSLDAERKERAFRDIWARCGAWRIKHQVTATKYFDLCVNMGAKQATVIVQRACRANGFPVDEDGVLGLETLRAMGSGGHGLLPAIRSEAAGFYRSLVAQKPNMQVFLKGWLKRAYL